MELLGWLSGGSDKDLRHVPGHTSHLIRRSSKNIRRIEEQEKNIYICSLAVENLLFAFHLCTEPLAPSHPARPWSPGRTGKWQDLQFYTRFFLYGINLFANSFIVYLYVRRLKITPLTRCLKGPAFLASPSGSPYSMRVFLDGQWEGVVDDQLNILNIQAPSGNVGGNQGSPQKRKPLRNI